MKKLKINLASLSELSNLYIEIYLGSVSFHLEKVTEEKDFEHSPKHQKESMLQTLLQVLMR